MDIPINNEREFLSYMESLITIEKNNSEFALIVAGNSENRYLINYDFKFPLSKEAKNALKAAKLTRVWKNYNFKINNCVFTKEVNINFDHKDITFENCNFDENIIFNDYDGILTFANCNFKEGYEVNAQDTIFKGKIRFRTCHFKGNVNFRNTTFNELADFWRCTFYNKTIFYKTDFKNIVVFSAVIFKENVLFTYSLIDKLLLLRGAKMQKGLDLSLAIITGKLGLFDFNLNDYKTTITSTEEQYETFVSETANIPVKNKRETFRILKDNLESQKNLAESLKFKAIEKDILSHELKHETFSASIFLDRANLFFNWLSNNHGNSYGRAFLFILGFGLFFFYFSLISLDLFSFTLDYKEWAFNESFRYYMEFLNPIHKFDYLGEDITLSKRFYVLDFLGKTFVGYGIYQFIQAFRKYK
ncbi:hypothetical protein AMR72_02245 [Flavobacterium psychrophilum]|nr:hypothetical protein AMR72_02245 [Flavobacterium psychrophilum]AOE51446.1 hypothetical protein ALW18_02245 [Flavobacterium psychrophilum]